MHFREIARKLHIMLVVEKIILNNERNSKEGRHIPVNTMYIFFWKISLQK
jgi:hypothetical protein